MTSVWHDDPKPVMANDDITSCLWLTDLLVITTFTETDAWWDTAVESCFSSCYLKHHFLPELDFRPERESVSEIVSWWRVKSGQSRTPLQQEVNRRKHQLSSCLHYFSAVLIWFVYKFYKKRIFLLDLIYFFVFSSINIHKSRHIYLRRKFIEIKWCLKQEKYVYDVIYKIKNLIQVCLFCFFMQKLT